MKREELLSQARKHLWAAWALSAEELASQAAATLLGLGMLVPEGGAGELERLRKRVAELEAERHSTNEALDDAVRELRARQVSDVDRSADKLTRLLAPTQALRVEAEPQGCGRCGIPEREHMQRWKPSANGAESGWHKWIAPTQEQLKTRMLARREANSGGGAE